ncbi:MAG: Asp-tRNA(Asn)/Glu-tRNA(Gln) amidotransferase GatCAB subunit A, partial [Halioglobus sp.]|nr:Asp-tRNA(Asn)/Glu-tRNA(Gln) amidotransferase GatCAB subunit A [Halioglobus sp.]
MAVDDSAFHARTLTELAQGLKARDFTSRELTEVLLERIAEKGRLLNAFITVTESEALVAADAADRLLAAQKGGPLTGVPIVHKDIFCTSGVRTTCGSRMLDNFISPYDATVVERLAAAGVVSLGKTNMDEFAMGSSNETSYFGNVINPWRKSDSNAALAPGGSSGGSSAAVSARLCPAATGTDTGGSIRQPAAFTGISGIKPTYGR